MKFSKLIVFLFVLCTCAKSQTIIQRETFSVSLPAKWTEDTAVESNKNARNVFFRNSESCKIMLKFPDESTGFDVDREMDLFLEMTKQQMVLTSDSRFTKWGRYEGKGILIKGKLKNGFAAQWRFFMFKTGERIVCILEFGLDKDWAIFEKDFALFQKTLEIQSSGPAIPVPSADFLTESQYGIIYSLIPRGSEITESIHKEFWSSIPVGERPFSAIIVSKLFDITVFMDTDFAIEGWRSARLSMQTGTPCFTMRFVELKESIQSRSSDMNGSGERTSLEVFKKSYESWVKTIDSAAGRREISADMIKNKLSELEERKERFLRLSVPAWK